ncbi:Uncharacterised protein [Mycobacteroides abscessus subsp. abscessus]|nr:Uncharacterised protein [Mycobacteroides abscessus subsp. abscessus]SKV88964.1 Uncharacterised protein [Mycobacteroides abscessus subsp. abscessus]
MSPVTSAATTIMAAPVPNRSRSEGPRPSVSKEFDAI